MEEEAPVDPVAAAEADKLADDEDESPAVGVPPVANGGAAKGVWGSRVAAAAEAAAPEAPAAKAAEAPKAAAKEEEEAAPAAEAEAPKEAPEEAAAAKDDGEDGAPGEDGGARLCRALARARHLGAFTTVRRAGGELKPSRSWPPNPTPRIALPPPQACRWPSRCLTRAACLSR